MIIDLNKKISTFFNVSIIFIARILKAITLFILTVLVARSFGPEGKGILALVIFLPEFLYFLFHLGLGNASIFYLSNEQETEKKVFNNSFWQGIFLSVFSVIGVLLLRLIYPNILGSGVPKTFLLLSLLMVPFSFLESFFENVFAGKQEFKTFVRIIIIDRILLLISILIGFLVFKISLISVVIIFLINLIAQVSTYFIILIKKYGFPNILVFDFKYFRKAIDFGFRSYVACFLCYLVLRSDLYMLSVMKGVKDVGFYSVATNFIDAMLLLSASASSVVFPLISHNLEKSIYYIKKITGWISISSLGMVILSWIFGKTFIILFFGEQFAISVAPFFILLIAMYFWSLLSIVTQFFAANNYPWRAVYIWIPGVILNIILNVVFIPKYGMVATAWTSVLAYTLTFFLHVILLQKYERVNIIELIIPQIFKRNTAHE